MGAPQATPKAIEATPESPRRSFGGVVRSRESAASGKPSIPDNTVIPSIEPRPKRPMKLSRSAIVGRRAHQGHQGPAPRESMNEPDEQRARGEHPRPQVDVTSNPRVDVSLAAVGMRPRRSRGAGDDRLPLSAADQPRPA